MKRFLSLFLGVMLAAGMMLVGGCGGDKQAADSK